MRCWGLKKTADLMTKVLGTREISDRLAEMNLEYNHRDGKSFRNYEVKRNKEMLEVREKVRCGKNGNICCGRDGRVCCGNGGKVCCGWGGRSCCGGK